MSTGLNEDALELHRKNKGKIATAVKIKLENKHDLSMAYTPGVAEVCRAIANNKESVYDYTIKGNTVAVVSDGTAVLGLGDIGPEAAMPVMEGKALLFKEFADVDAFPICLATKDVEEIVNIVTNIAPAFGGINLEDISAPRCFEIEERLQNLGIPVMHDDQHGTAIVILAALINASKVTGKKLENMRIVISGAGAAGTAVANLLLCVGMDRNICTSVKEIIVCDRQGIISRDRTDLTGPKKKLAGHTNPLRMRGTLADAMKGADVFIGLSSANLVSKDMVKSMAPKSIVFAMANPTPEIMPDDAKAAGAFIVGTGRSDYPNQINNVLAFPGVFRGALSVKASRIDDRMKIYAAHALARCITNPTTDKILPDALDKSVAPAIAEAVKKAAHESGLARV